jgi:hypothetical protein
MVSIRFVPACALTLIGCGGMLPTTVAADPDVAEKVRSLSASSPCSDSIAGVLTAYRVPPGRIVEMDLPTTTRDYPGASADRQAWFKLADRGGSIVVEYDPDHCLVTAIYPRYGATLPEIG